MPKVVEPQGAQACRLPDLMPVLDPARRATSLAVLVVNTNPVSSLCSLATARPASWFF
jgi:hypothetical protein